MRFDSLVELTHEKSIWRYYIFWRFWVKLELEIPWTKYIKKSGSPGSPDSANYFEFPLSAKRLVPNKNTLLTQSSCNFIIYALLSQNCVVKIHALFLQNFWYRFWMYASCLQYRFNILLLADSPKPETSSEIEFLPLKLSLKLNNLTLS